MTILPSLPRSTFSSLRNRKRGLALGLAVALACSMAPGLAQAESSGDLDTWIIKDGDDRHSHKQLTLELNAWGDLAGVGAWFAFPILPAGFLPINDALLIEAGAVFGTYRGAFGNNAFNDLAVSLGVGPRWDFHFTGRWSAFATLKLGIDFGLAGYNRSGLMPIGTIGSHIRLGEVVLLRIELGNPFGLGLGLTFQF